MESNCGQQCTFEYMNLVNIRTSVLLLAALLTTLASLPAFAQRAAPPNSKVSRASSTESTIDPAARIYQLSGLVIGQKSGEPVPFALVRVGTSRRTTTATADGFFSLPVLGGDTLVFQSIGYRYAKLSIAEYLKDYKGDVKGQYIYVVVYLAEDSITLPNQVIFPYRTPEELRTALLNVPMSDNDPNAVARAIMTPELMAEYVQTLPVDSKERQAAAAQQYYLNYKAQNSIANVGLFDPFAVARMVGYLKRKAKTEREKTYDYWPEERPK